MPTTSGAAKASFFRYYFRGSGPLRVAEHGTVLHFEHLGARIVKTHLAGFVGTWRVADFGGTSGAAHDPDRALALDAELAAAYVLLAAAPENSTEAIKRAFRLLARRLHPDVNASPDAHEDMQRLNAAYARIAASRGMDERGI